MCTRSFPPCQSPSSSQHSRAIKPGAAGQERSSGTELGGAERRDCPGAGRSQPAAAEAGRRGQRGAGCHRRLARAAGGNLEVPPPPPQEGPGLAAPSGLREPFPATERRSDAGESAGKSRCAGTREQPYLSSALPLLFFFEEGCAGKRRPGFVRGRRGTLPATQVSAFPPPIPAGRRPGRWLAQCAGAAARAPALGSRSRREKGRQGARVPRPGAACPEPPEMRRDSRLGTCGEGWTERGSAVMGGRAPCLPRARIAPVRAVREPQREPGAAPLRTPGVSARVRRAQEPSVSARPGLRRTSSLPAPQLLRPSRLHPSVPAAQPIRRSVPWPARGGVVASPPCPRPSWSAPGSRSSAPTAQQCAGGEWGGPVLRAEGGGGAVSLSSAPSVHTTRPSCSLNRWPREGKLCSQILSRSGKLGGLRGCWKPRRRGESICLHLDVSDPTVNWTVALTSVSGIWRGGAGGRERVCVCVCVFLSEAEVQGPAAPARRRRRAPPPVFAGRAQRHRATQRC